MAGRAERFQHIGRESAEPVLPAQFAAQTILDDFQPVRPCSSSSPCQLHASPACSPVPYVASPDRHFSTMIRRLGGSSFLFSPEAPPRQYALPAAGSGDRQQAPSLRRHPPQRAKACCRRRDKADPEALSTTLPILW